jgi:hypothetical protein
VKQDHDWGEWRPHHPGDCNFVKRSCERCEETDIDYSLTPHHLFTPWEPIGQGRSSRVCANCGQRELAEPKG